MPGWDYWTEHDRSVETQGDISMKKILGLMLGLSFVFGTLAFAQDAGSSTTTTKTKKEKKHKKNKGDKMSGDTTTAPKQ
jgi:Ni/Co efflux regulator RcnB